MARKPQEPITRTFSLEPDLREVARGRGFLRELALQAGFSEEKVFDITVACSEAIANAVEHANADGGVEVSTFLYPDRLEVQIEGPGEFQPPSRAAERLNRGLGLPLMATLSDHLALYSGPHGGTRVGLTFYRPGALRHPESEDALPPSIRELIEENELVHQITQNAPVGIYVLGADLRFRWANPVYNTFLDEPYRSQELTGLYFGDVVPQAARALLIADLQEVSQTGRALLREDTRLEGHSRGPAWRRRRVIPLTEGREQPPYDLLVVVSDETARKLAEVEQERLFEESRTLSDRLFAANVELEAKNEELQRQAEELAAHEEELRCQNEELRESIEAVREAEARYRALFDTLIEGFCTIEVIFDPHDNPVDYRFLETNPAFEKLTGLHDARGKLVRDLAPDHEEHWFQIYGKVALTGESVRFIAPAEALGRWYDVCAYRVGGAGSRQLAILFNDITKRKRAEDALKEQEAVYHGLFSSMQEGFCIGELITDDSGRPIDYRIVEANEAMERQTGLPVEQILSSTAMERNPEGAPFFVETYGRVALKGEPVHFERYLPQHDRHYEVSALQVRPGRFAAIFSDITERKKMDEALRESQKKYQSLIEANADFIWEMDAYGRYTYCSPQIETLWGLKPEDMVGKTPFDMMPDGDMESAAEFFLKIAESARSFRGLHTTAYDAQGRLVIVETNGVPILDDGGGLLGYRGTSRDITERKRLEAERDRLLAEEQLQREELAAANEELRCQSEELEARNAALVAIDEQRTRDRRLNELLADVAATSLAELNEEAVLLRVVGEGVSALRADWLAYLKSGPAGWERHLEAGERAYSLQVKPNPLLPSWTARLLVERVPFVVPAGGSGDPEFKTFLLVPVFAAGEVHGILQFGYRQAVTLAEPEFAFARRLSYVISLALQNARLYESQRDIAVKLQQSLLDVSAEAHGVQFGHLYRSASTGASIGGDFYDVFTVKERRAGVLIGDVSGHGVEAARIATLVKDIVFALAHQFDRPATVLQKANSLLLERGTPGFVTLFLGVLDPETGVFRYGSAGHPNPLVRRAAGGVEFLKAASYPLGVFPDVAWKGSSVKLRQGDLLLLYTDGAIEARRNGDFFGQHRLAEALEKWSDPSPELLPQAVLSEILGFSQGVLTDDIALLALRLKDGKGRAKKG